MPFRINHLHVKSRDPKRSADWFISAFNFSIVSDESRSTGERFIRCTTEDGALRVNFSGERYGESLPDGPNGIHLGLEHFGIDVVDLQLELRRLLSFGACLEGQPGKLVNGQQYAFIRTPDGVRVELMQPPSEQG
ncbi:MULTISPECIES: VOC family protein [unclassified Chelatococcus]|uniref:VOC family protein n=1 Tax=unclassified Chelatococcus TaxID=2638111 RepID=UPI001BCE63C2|nr:MULTISPECIES: VOC family protein [unclassified Chelatococcus]MBS7701547.1 VOC family protein [Chelatococcus sp. YT9]MBX3557382.1 VOC family protein [Chelatococcus sp.]